MSEIRTRRLPGFTSDLAFSFVTYLVLATILGVCALAVRPALEPIIGTFFANCWRLAVALAYCTWQVRTSRRLRRAGQTQSEDK